MNPVSCPPYIDVDKFFVYPFHLRLVLGVIEYLYVYQIALFIVDEYASAVWAGLHVVCFSYGVPVGVIG